ncbi:N-acetylglucosamine-6-phosphate deacetylase [Bellilinea sp.]|uniref:N-acetylglucosamine-6-phosphate deacetylase n=1 Tax=Bellilinea sp. TaxID=2838785 RepID=UPI002ADE1D23|nr:N-acetylglucosamine-6-phosphate deacetylase [Bellilinea sp.]
MATLIWNAKIYTPNGILSPGWLTIENRTISRLGSGQPPATELEQAQEKVDAHQHHLLPGLIDLHIHGAMGFEFMDGDLHAIEEIAQFLVQHGVTAFLATTWAAPQSALLKALDAVGNAYGRIRNGAALLGAYLEGPYMNPNRAGAQAIQFIRQATNRQEALTLIGHEMVKVVSLAPEYPENFWLIDACVSRGITVAAGHTSATYEQMEVAVQRGVSLLTHCFNAMSPFHHREPGVVGAGMTMPELRCELIADNVHVHPLAQRILYQLRGSEGIVLVSDSTRVTGLPDGQYILDNRPVQVKEGKVSLLDGTLAGSGLTLERALRNFTNAVGISLQEAVLSASLYPARAIGIAHQKGSLEPGKDADLFLMDDEGNILLTMVEGKMVYIRT